MHDTHAIMLRKIAKHGLVSLPKDPAAAFERCDLRQTCYHTATCRRGSQQASGPNSVKRVADKHGPTYPSVPCSLRLLSSPSFVAVFIIRSPLEPTRSLVSAQGTRVLLLNRILLGRGVCFLRYGGTVLPFDSFVGPAWWYLPSS